jgi:AraC-like DNA-binding protein
MPFHYYNPSPQLSMYIRSYWTLRGEDEVCDVLYPDGCVDILANLGRTFITQQNVVIEERCIYLGGALTEAMYECLPTDVVLLGVRFQPGCFADFYPPYTLSKVTNGCIRISENTLPPLIQLTHDPVPVLDKFFLEKLKGHDSFVKNAILAITQSGGNASLAEIASTCNRSPRQTERIFKQTVGLTPKQFSKIIKFGHFQKLLEAKSPEETLLGVALDAGYYDHAHLTKQYKSITRHNPSEK